MPETLYGKDYQFRRSMRERQPPIRKGHYNDLELGIDLPLVVAFGPLYREVESEEWRMRKDEAWKHVLGSETNESETTRRFVEAMRRKESKARELYAWDNSTDNLSSDEFIWMMIKDGCFMLQVALFVLGGSKQLAHLPNDSTFGQPGGKKWIRAAISSMFCVGNQLPRVVLKALMRQNFFSRVINQGKWKKPMDLERRVLFEVLVLPALAVASAATNSSVLKTVKSGGICMGTSVEEPRDLLHGLWWLMTGDDFDEDDYYDDDDDEDINKDSHYDVLPTVRSATDLKQVGIIFKADSKGTGIREISFRNNMFKAVLTLPRIVIIDFDTTKLLLESLIHYEVTQQLPESRRKVCAYLQLMRELICSPDDAKLLSTHGIILADPMEEERLPELFQGLPIPRVKNNNYLFSIRDQISNYSQPSKWKSIRDILSIVILLTVVQTVYAILGYHHTKH